MQSARWLNVDDTAGDSQRLFTAGVSRVKATYTFTSKLFARGIAQYVYTTRDPSLYIDVVSRRAAEFGGSALLAYKLNWQSVIFIGYGDDRELTDAGASRAARSSVLREGLVRVSALTVQASAALR